MFRLFFPYEYIDSVFSIDYQKLYNLGFRGLIFDIDNTLVHHGDDSTEEVDNLFKMIQNIGFQTCILSNNNEKRVKSFLTNIDSLYICNAEKPHTTNYIKAIKLMNLQKDNTIFIGDQIFTDILGANKSGIANILVKFIRLENETKIGKKRQLENIILMLYQKNKHYQHRLGNINKEKGGIENVIK